MRISFIVLLLGTIVSWACLEGDPLHDITGDRLPNGNIQRDTLYATNTGYVIEGKVSTAVSTKLLFGKYKEFEARSLIQFGSVPDDSIKVDSLRIVLTAIDNQGVTSGPIQGSAHLVTGYWPETVNADEQWDWKNNISYDPEYTARFEVGPETSTYQIIDLPASLMNVWQDTVGGNKNFGLLLDFQYADYIKQYSSVDALFSGQRPRLVYVWHDEAQDSTHHDTLYVSQDASLIDFTGNFDQEKLYVSSGYSVRSFFEFNLTEIPASAALSTMNLVVKRDTLSSVMNNLSLESMYLRIVTTPFINLPSYSVDSTFIQNLYYNITVLGNSDNEAQIRTSDRGTGSQNFMQSIINGDVEYGSFMLQYKAEGEDISVYSIYNGSSDPDNRPMFIVEYFDIPNTRM